MTPNRQVWLPVPRARTLGRIAKKLVSPRDLARYLRWRFEVGSEYLYFDFADGVPFAAELLSRVVPARTDIEAPVLLAGLRRSGTTLFYRIMNAHPKVHLFNERFPGDRYRGHGRATADNIWSETETKRFRGITRRYISPRIRLGGYRWGAKLALELAHPDPGSVSTEGMLLVARALPRATVLGIVRDPRDFVLSAMKRAGRSADFWIDEYLVMLGLFDDLAKSEQPRFVVIRYEDLVSNPHETIERCCVFLGIDVVPDMLEPARWSTKGPAVYASDRIVAQAGKWRSAGEELRPVVKRVTDRCFPAAERYGFRRDGEPDGT